MLLNRLCVFFTLLTAIHAPAATPSTTESSYRIATFEADITIPIGHACTGGGIADARVIRDPLWAKGLVLLGAGELIVLVALDWCQCNNDSYDRWRDALAAAAGTSPQRVMLATVHQHDAPICDLAAQKLLDKHGLVGWNCDPEFHEKAVRRTADAIKMALKATYPVTHVGIGQARVERIACNRRVVTPDGKVNWNRTSASGDATGAPEGEIDPFLKTISLWERDRPVAAWSCYSVHPMSRYGEGEVSADFPGMARAQRQKDDPSVFQIYFTGCAGDTTAGKYNDGNPKNRQALADRLYDGMLQAWKSTQRFPIAPIGFRSVPLTMPARATGAFTIDGMQQTLANSKLKRWERISAALGLSWRARVDANHPIEVPCLDLADGKVQFTIMPAETFVGYQLAAQRLRPESFVMVSGFGDGAPGYIPTQKCWEEGYSDHYCWITPESAPLMMNALAAALGAQTPSAAALSRPSGK